MSLKGYTLLSLVLGKLVFDLRTHLHTNMEQSKDQAHGISVFSIVCGPDVIALSSIPAPLSEKRTSSLVFQVALAVDFYLFNKVSPCWLQRVCWDVRLILPDVEQ